ncbi:MAG: hypothetical protein ACOZBZ_02740 [Patescibacteria group bacterium]
MEENTVTAQNLQTSPLKKVLLCLLSLIIVVLLIEGGYYLYLQKQIKLKEIELYQEQIKTGGGLRNLGQEISGFSGEVKERGENFLILEGGGKTIKVEINSQVAFWEIPWVLEESVSQFIHRKPKVVDFAAIKKGDFVDVTGKYKGDLLTAMTVMVYGEKINE